MLTIQRQGEVVSYFLGKQKQKVGEIIEFGFNSGFRKRLAR